MNILDLARPRTLDQWEACQLILAGRRWFVLMGRDPHINRMAKALAVFARPKPKPPDRFERRIILTPAEARRLNAPQ